MTEEMVKVLEKRHTEIMMKADNALDNGNQVLYNELIMACVALDSVAKEFGYTFRETFSGTWVLVRVK